MKNQCCDESSALTCNTVIWFSYVSPPIAGRVTLVLNCDEPFGAGSMMAMPRFYPGAPLTSLR